MKPANVLLTNDGRAKILNFGLARMHEMLSGAPPFHRETAANLMT